MAREHEDFRVHLERLDKVAPGVELFRPGEVGKLLGVCRQTAAKRYPFKDGYINKVALARALAKESKA